MKIRIPKKIPTQIPNGYSMTLKDNRNSKCYVSIWQKDMSIAISNKMVSLVKSLLINYWKSYFRTLPTCLIDIKRNLKINTLTKYTFGYILKEEPIISLLYCDVNNFKEVSSKFSYKDGDLILREVAAILEALTSNNAILLHNGGDEFLIIVAGSQRLANKLAKVVKHSIRAHKFSTNSVHLDMCVGISSTRKAEDFDLTFESSYRAMQNNKRYRHHKCRLPP